MRGMAAAALAAVTAAAAACTPAPGPQPAQRAAATPAQCVALFQDFDRVEDLLDSSFRRRDNWVVDPWLQMRGIRLNQAGCITHTDELTGLDSAGGTVSDSGIATTPISVHAGVVTSMNDEARVFDFFESRGVRVRSMGSAALGRRIFLGPYATVGAVESAIDLSRQAGFIAPYPRQF
jgi:hypothetical protein